MLLCVATNAEVASSTSTTAVIGDPLLNGVRPPVTIVETGKVRLGGAYRLPLSTADSGKVRSGGGYRLPVQGA